MSYRGYGYEYKNKKIFEKRGLTLKLGKGQYTDLISIDFSTGEGIIYLIECKTRKCKKWYPNVHDKTQFIRLMELKSEIEKNPILYGYNKIKIIYRIRVAGIEKEYSLNEVKDKYFKKL